MGMTSQQINIETSGFQIPSSDPENLDKNSHADQQNTTETGSFSDSQFPPFFTQPRIENIILNEDQHEDQVEKQQPWSMEDDKMLVSAWLTISTNSVVGTSQNDRTFWKRVTDYFNENRQSGPRRKTTSCKQHWFWIISLINKFNQIYNRLLGEHHSGWSDDQLKEHARTLYYQNRKKHFIHKHVWVMLKDDPKWKPNTPLARSSKKLKINESGAYTSSSHADTSIDVDDSEVEVRLIGQKATKAKRKGKSNVVEKSNIDEQMKARWAELQEWRNEKLAEVRSLKKSFEMVADHQILTMDTSHMNAEQLENRLMCNVIKSKYNI
ncbi:glutathione S-transferase T3 [Dioscorea cayenensis subsp. rotundata]|uniref:Glutathione S-transferase T3 n=1 Tax=Dioscorea cayennensis subsp. rotundata TaxID=55577 RepID=A0AB40CSZ6_DIOCR|nr:glutathione S-transferase T3 [Dioscorea cayenensis subsp. rotundata]